MRGADLLRDVVEAARRIVVGWMQLAGGVKRRERRLRLDCELEERNMLPCFQQCSAQFARPLLRRLLRPGINQIERIAVEHRARDADRIKSLALRMCAPQRGKRAVVERLHAKRNAIDAGGAIAAKALRLD